MCEIQPLLEMLIAHLQFKINSRDVSYVKKDIQQCQLQFQRDKYIQSETENPWNKSRTEMEPVGQLESSLGV